MHKSQSNWVVGVEAGAGGGEREKGEESMWGEDKLEFWETQEYCVESLNVFFIWK